MIDFRSDTVTRPSKEMLHQMFNAEVGDDVFGDDPNVNALEKEAAEMFGKEAALFCSSGTQTNQIAIKAHTQPGEELICDRLSHIYNYEGGGIAFNSGVQVRYVFGERGIFTADDVLQNINADDPHFAKTSLVCIENTVNKGGGSIWSLDEMQNIKNACNKNNLKLHLDGARLFNALVETGITTQQIGNTFDSISICLSKGLGCPIGSLLLGNKEFIYKSRRLRKVFGGGMRQAGFVAAAGRFALKNNIERLKHDHLKAKQIEQILSTKNYVSETIPVQTNIVIFKLKQEVDTNKFLEHLLQHNIKTVSSGPQTIRLVTHLNIKNDDLNIVKLALEKFSN
ncbi:MAG: low-specificity L-threonine aldolase [Bacteroidota bacterium]|jgi:threonine aldolase